MTITTAQSISNGLWDSGTYAGTLTATRQLAPQEEVSGWGATDIINAGTLAYADPTTPNPTFLVTAGIDPVLQVYFQNLYEVKLRTTGQIWPVGFS